MNMLVLPWHTPAHQRALDTTMLFHGTSDQGRLWNKNGNKFQRGRTPVCLFMVLPLPHAIHGGVSFLHLFSRRPPLSLPLSPCRARQQFASGNTMTGVCAPTPNDTYIAQVRYQNHHSCMLWPFWDRNIPHVCLI